MNCCIPNVHGKLPGEADLLVIRPSLWAEEVEIKISKADFKREFIKKAAKHRVLSEGSKIMHYDWRTGNLTTLRTDPHLISRFWFAMPMELAEELLPEIPGHAGLLGVAPRPTPWSRPIVKVIKTAPKLKMGRKLTEAEKSYFLRLALFRYWDIRHKEAS